MRNFENANRFKKEGFKPHQIILAVTTKPDYEMERKILLSDIEGLEEDEYLVLEGYHCSCYDFDETNWEGTIYDSEELIKVAKSYENDTFWKEVLIYVEALLIL